MSINDRQNRIIHQMNALGDWMDKYDYLIERGRHLQPMDCALKTDAHAITGCQSRVWMTSEMDEGVVCYSIDSDALIAKGLIGLLLDVLNRVPPEEILKADLYFIAKTGLESHLSPQRANGLTSIVLHMKESASSYVHPGRGPSVH